MAEEVSLEIQKDLFVEKYLQTLSHTKAARELGVSSQSCRALLNDPAVRAEILERVDELRKLNSVETGLVLSNLALFANTNISDFLDFGVDDQDRRRPRFTLATCDPRKLAAIKEIELDELGYVSKVKLHDSMKANELLGKYLSLFVEKHEFSGPGGGPIPILQVEFVKAEVTAK